MGYRPTAWCQTYEFTYKAPKWAKGTSRNYTKGHPGNTVTLWQLPSSLGLFSTSGAEDYWASKFGVVGIHESLHHELKAAKKDRIKTMFVCPNPVDTDMLRGCWISKEIEPFLPRLKPDYCVKQAMKATLTDQPMTCTPCLKIHHDFHEEHPPSWSSCVHVPVPTSTQVYVTVCCLKKTSHKQYWSKNWNRRIFFWMAYHFYQKMMIKVFHWSTSTLLTFSGF